MDKKEHGENFSSPSDNLHITNVQNWGTTGEVLKIYLSNGSSFFISAGEYGRSDLKVGNELSENDILFLHTEDEYITTRQKALSLLDYSENSAFQLKTKLLRKGCSKTAMDRVVAELEAAGYVDDRRYAEMWIRSRIRNRPAGGPVLIGLLRKRGISREIAETVVREQLEEMDTSVLLMNAAEKLRKNRTMSPEKMKNRLLKLGFPFSEVREYLENFISDENC